MYTIYKYPITVTDRPTVKMPRGASVLSVQGQGMITYIWAIVDPKEPEENREFYLQATGQPLEFEPSTTRFIGTFQLFEVRLVYHLFEIARTQGEGK